MCQIKIISFKNKKRVFNGALSIFINMYYYYLIFCNQIVKNYDDKNAQQMLIRGFGPKTLLSVNCLSIALFYFLSVSLPVSLDM